jgi:HD-GYP domain-containing protein (c-di-GMP phosphodiesterase class II)
MPPADHPDRARLLLAVQQHDPQTALHMSRVSQYAGLIATGLGLGAARVEEVAHVCALHDIGKLGVPAAMLNKRDELTPAELHVMGRHVRHGHGLLRNARFELAPLCAQVALHHHEKFDGHGYPDGLRGDGIPLYARIAAIADVFDALTSRRPYRDPLGCDFALEYVRRQGGLHFDPDCVEAFIAEEPRILEVRREGRASSDALASASEEIEQ